MRTVRPGKLTGAAPQKKHATGRQQYGTKESARSRTVLAECVVDDHSVDIEVELRKTRPTFVS